MHVLQLAALKAPPGAAHTRADALHTVSMQPLACLFRPAPPPCPACHLPYATELLYDHYPCSRTSCQRRSPPAPARLSWRRRWRA